jgi:hypothetical protein
LASLTRVETTTSSSPSTFLSAGWTWQASVTQAGSFMIGLMTPSAVPPWESVSMRVRFASGSRARGGSERWQTRQASDFMSVTVSISRASAAYLISPFLL